MKIKTFIAIFSLVALTTQAAQINWGSQGQMYDGTTLMTGANGYSITGYLVYLGTTGADWGSFSISTATLSVGGNVVATKAGNAAGGNLVAALSPFAFANGDAIGSGSDVITDESSTFGIAYIATFTDADDNVTTKYLLSDPFVYDTTPSQTGAAWNAGMNTFTYLSQNTGSGSTWTAIPEPATAGLAIAGLALLFKRRRK